MCGIAGYAGECTAKKFLIEGMEKLEYRGYDSSGIATMENGVIMLTKAKGKLKELIEKTKNSAHKGNVGIGHTRWATHGKPDELNSHPHTSQNGMFAVVHNGIIENYLSLKKKLENNGFEFKTETDTEVIPNLIEYFYTGSVFDAFVKAVSMLKGSYALGLISCYEPDKIFAVSKDSPLVVGVGINENYIASDIHAFLSKTNKFYFMKEGEFAVVSKEKISFCDINKVEIKKDIVETNRDEALVDKQGYEFFMLKEIMEQPKAIADTIVPRIKNGFTDLSELKIPTKFYESLNKIYIVACGSAYHAGMAGKKMIEDLARVQVIVELASEFKYSDPIVENGDLVIAISQSGETSDTLAALKLAKEKGAAVVSIVNVKESSIARESPNVIYTHAGPEIAVATTKAYITQIAILYLMAIYIAVIKKHLPSDKCKEFIRQITNLPAYIEDVFKQKDKINELSEKFLKSDKVFFIGRGFDYSLAMEGALKLKEISYIQSESYAAGELKHGTISLIEEGTPVFALCTQKDLFEKMTGNIKEVKARGAKVVVIKTTTMPEIENLADYIITVPEVNKYISGILAVIHLQLFAYYVSYNKGLDVDKPRNLAKSVTVE